jgi:hypothetical protein
VPSGHASHCGARSKPTSASRDLDPAGHGVCARAPRIVVGSTKSDPTKPGAIFSHKPVAFAEENWSGGHVTHRSPPSPYVPGSHAKHTGVARSLCEASELSPPEMSPDSKNKSEDAKRSVASR